MQKKEKNIFLQIKYKRLKFLVILFIFSIFSMFLKEYMSSEKIHFINVWGDAILIESNNHYALIDAGEDNDNPRKIPTRDFSVDDKKVITYLKSVMKRDWNGKLHFDFIEASHAHSDHMGGLDAIINNKDVVIDKAYVRKYKSENIKGENEWWDNQEVYNQLVTALRYKKIKIISSISDLENSKQVVGNFKVRFFSTEKGYKNWGTKEDIVRENENSIVTKITNIKNGKTALLTGDLNYITNKLDSKGDEFRIANKVGKIDVLKLGHHGYEKSNSSYLLNKTSPSILIGTSAQGKISYIQKWLKKHTNNQVYQQNLNGDMVVDLNNPKTYGMKKYNNCRKDVVNKWIKVNKRWKYHTSLANTATEKTLINDKYYIFNNLGWLQKNKMTRLHNKKYFTNGKGIILSGIVDFKNEKYLVYDDFKSPNYGEMAVNTLLKINNKTMYANENGHPQKGWQKINNKKYYFKDDFSMAIGWIKIDNKLLHFSPEGILDKIK